MRKILTALTVAALLMPAAAAAQVQPAAAVQLSDPDMLLPVPKGTPARVVLDDRASCFGGRIGQLRQNNTRMTANKEARRLRKLGYAVDFVHLSSGFDRSIPMWPVKYYTAIC